MSAGMSVATRETGMVWSGATSAQASTQVKSGRRVCKRVSE